MIRFPRTTRVAIAAFALLLGAGFTAASAEPSAPADSASETGAHGATQTAPVKKATKEVESAKPQHPQHHAVSGKEQSATASQTAGHATPSQQPAVTQ